MSIESPYISVLLCVYNGGVDLKHAIESILNQTFTDFELIIIDDGSTDDSWSIISEYALIDSRIVARWHKNVGLTKSLNRGLKLCRGKFIARQDADDVSDVRRFERQVALSKHHNIIFSRAYKNSKIVPSSFLMKFPFQHLLITGNILIHGTMLINAELIKTYRYDERYKYAQDFDLYIRLFKGGHVPFVMREPFYTLGVSEKQISKKRAGEQFKCVIDSMNKNGFDPKYILFLAKIKYRALKNLVRTMFVMYLLVTSLIRFYW